MYAQVHTKVSLRGFTRVVGVPYWRLRDYRRAATRRQQREQGQQAFQHVVHQAALEQPTYGYRRLYYVLKARGRGIGRERVRQLLAMLGLAHERLPKKRRATPAVTAMAELPPGRRVQIDATRLALSDGVTWVYVVEDAASRACLAVSVGRGLSQERAAQALLEGHRVLQQRGLTTALVVQSDGGSEFTSAHFQRCCQAIGAWVRSRVNQVGGMGLVERLNRTFKYDVVFRHEVATSFELKALVSRFRDWYNQERLHSSLGYQTPWQRLLADATILT